MEHYLYWAHSRCSIKIWKSNEWVECFAVLSDAYILHAVGKAEPGESESPTESPTVFNDVTLGNSFLSPVSLFVKWWIYKILGIFARLNNMVLVSPSRKPELMQTGDPCGNILQYPTHWNVTFRLGQMETSGY